MPEVVTIQRQIGAAIKVSSPANTMLETQRAARKKIEAELPKLDTGPLGWTFTLWRSPTDGVVEMLPGTFVGHSFYPKGEVLAIELPSGKAAHHVMRGSPEGLPGAWRTLFGWCAQQKLQLNGLNLEIYRFLDEDRSIQETALYALLV